MRRGIHGSIPTRSSLSKKSLYSLLIETNEGQAMPDNTFDIDFLFDELLSRIKSDVNRKARWRLFHRTAGIIFTVISIAFPLALTAGFSSSDEVTGKMFLYVVAFVGGLNVLFNPYMHASRRRSEMNTSRRLYDKVRGVLAAGGLDHEGKCVCYQSFSEEFSQIYGARGDSVLDGELAKAAMRQRENEELTQGSETAAERAP